MYKIITYLSGGKRIQKFNSFEEANDEWTRFDPWHGHCKTEVFCNDKLWISNKYQ